MKRLWFCVLSTVLCLTLAVVANDGLSSGEKQQEKNQDKQKDGDKEKKKKGKEKEKPRDIIGTVEMRDGSTVNCLFLDPKEMKFLMVDLGSISIPTDNLRFVEMEGKENRVLTFGRDVYVGKIQTDQFQVKLLTNNKEVTLNVDRIKRMTFPDPPQKVETPEIIPVPMKDKDGKKDKEDKKD